MRFISKYLIFQIQLQQAQKETAVENKEIEDKEKRKNRDPYLTNLNEDPMLSQVIFHFLGAKQTKIGRSPECKIQINGLNIITEHALIANENGKISITPGEIGAKIKVNGINVEESRVLQHRDRILIGLHANFKIFKTILFY